MLKITNFKGKEMKRVIVAAALVLTGTANAEVVPGAVGAPASFPTGYTSAVAAEVKVDTDNPGGCSGTGNVCSDATVYAGAISAQNSITTATFASEGWLRVGRMATFSVTATIDASGNSHGFTVTFAAGERPGDFQECNGNMYSNGASACGIRFVSSTAFDVLCHQVAGVADPAAADYYGSVTCRLAP